MFIQKNYNVKSLAETLDGALSVALDNGKIAVEIGLLEANEIKEILEMMAVGEAVRKEGQELVTECNFPHVDGGNESMAHIPRARVRNAGVVQRRDEAHVLGL